MLLPVLEKNTDFQQDDVPFQNSATFPSDDSPFVAYFISPGIQTIWSLNVGRLMDYEEERNW
jgi:hypothetical protein